MEVVQVSTLFMYKHSMSVHRTIESKGKILNSIQFMIQKQKKIYTSIFTSFPAECCSRTSIASSFSLEELYSSVNLKIYILAKSLVYHKHLNILDDSVS